MKTKNNKPAARSAHKPAKRRQAPSKKPTKEALTAAYRQGYRAGIEAANSSQGLYLESAHARYGYRRGQKDGRRVLEVKQRVERYRAGGKR